MHYAVNHCIRFKHRQSWWKSIGCLSRYHYFPKSQKKLQQICICRLLLSVDLTLRNHWNNDWIHDLANTDIQYLILHSFTAHLLKTCGQEKWWFWSLQDLIFLLMIASKSKICSLKQKSLPCCYYNRQQCTFYWWSWANIRQQGLVSWIASDPRPKHLQLSWFITFCSGTMINKTALRAGRAFFCAFTG